MACLVSHDRAKYLCRFGFVFCVFRESKYVFTASVLVFVSYQYSLLVLFSFSNSCMNFMCRMTIYCFESVVTFVGRLQKWLPIKNLRLHFIFSIISHIFFYSVILLSCFLVKRKIRVGKNCKRDDVMISLFSRQIRKQKI